MKVGAGAIAFLAIAAAVAMLRGSKAPSAGIPSVQPASVGTLEPSAAPSAPALSTSSVASPLPPSLQAARPPIDQSPASLPVAVAANDDLIAVRNTGAVALRDLQVSAQGIGGSTHKALIESLGPGEEERIFLDGLSPSAEGIPLRAVALSARSLPACGKPPSPSPVSLHTSGSARCWWVIVPVTLGGAEARNLGPPTTALSAAS